MRTDKHVYLINCGVGTRWRGDWGWESGRACGLDDGWVGVECGVGVGIKSIIIQTIIV